MAHTFCTFKVTNSAVQTSYSLSYQPGVTGMMNKSSLLGKVRTHWHMRQKISLYQHTIRTIYINTHNNRYCTKMPLTQVFITLLAWQSNSQV